MAHAIDTAGGLGGSFDPPRYSKNHDDQDISPVTVAP